jgi:hypothetical protein
MGQPVCFLQVWVLAKQYLYPLLLFLCPFFCRLEQQIPATGQMLLFCVTIGKGDVNIVSIVQAGILHGICFLVDGIPAMGNTYFLEGIVSQLLNMKPVDNQRSSAKTPFYVLVHGSGHVQGYFFNK